MSLVQGGKLVIPGYYSDPGGTAGLFGALFVVKLLAGDPSREPISVSKLSGWLREIDVSDGGEVTPVGVLLARRSSQGSGADFEADGVH